MSNAADGSWEARTEIDFKLDTTEVSFWLCQEQFQLEQARENQEEVEVVVWAIALRSHTARDMRNGARAGEGLAAKEESLLMVGDDLFKP